MQNKSTIAGSIAISEKDFSFQPGQLLRFGATVFRIIDIDMPSVSIEHAVTTERKHMLHSSLVREYLAGNIVPCSAEAITRANAGDGFLEDDVPYVVRNAVSIMSPAAQGRGLFILKYRDALREAGFTVLRTNPLLEMEVERIAKHFGDTNPPKLSTLYSYELKIRKADGDLRAVFPNYASRGGRRNSRCDQELMAALDGIIQARLNNPHAQLRISDMEKDLKTVAAQQKGDVAAMLTVPSRSTISRRVKTFIAAYKFKERKHGKRAADEAFRNYTPRDRAQGPLQIVEFDDKNTRTFAIDQEYRLPCGRIHVTSGVDQYSSAVLGFSIGYEHRSTLSALNCMANCVRPKDMSLLDFSEVEEEIQFFGKFAIAIFDNALYNHAKAIEVAAIDITNAVVCFAKPYSPTEKAIVEDFNGKMVSEFLVTLRGYGGAKLHRGELQNAETAANVSLQEFKASLNKWTYDVFCNTPREGGMTPRQRWESGLQLNRPMLPADIWRIRLACMLNATVKLRPEVLRHHGLIYKNHRLVILQDRLGHKARIHFKYDPEKLTHVFVLDPYVSEWFLVESVNPEYTQGLTLLQHNLIRKMARDSGLRNPSIPQMLVQREKLVQLVNQLGSSTKLKERNFAVTVGCPGASNTGSVGRMEIVTELEDKVAQIAEVEMAAGDDDWSMPTDDLYFTR